MRFVPFCLLLSVTAMIGVSGTAHSQNAPTPQQKPFPPPSSTANAPIAPPPATACPSGDRALADAVGAADVKLFDAKLAYMTARAHLDVAERYAKEDRQRSGDAHFALIAANRDAKRAKADADMQLSTLRYGIERLHGMEARREAIKNKPAMAREKETPWDRDAGPELDADIARLRDVQLKHMRADYDAADSKAFDAERQARSAAAALDLAKTNDDHSQEVLRAAQQAENMAGAAVKALERALDDAEAALALAKAKPCPPPAPAPNSATKAPAALPTVPATTAIIPPAPPPCPTDGGYAGVLNHIACQDSR